MKEYTNEELEIQKEMEELNHPDNVAYRNRNGCEFEREEKESRFTFWDLKESMEEM